MGKYRSAGDGGGRASIVVDKTFVALGEIPRDEKHSPDEDDEIQDEGLLEVEVQVKYPDETGENQGESLVAVAVEVPAVQE